MNLLLRLATISVLFVPISLELRNASERAIQARMAKAGTVTSENTTCFRNEAHRRLFERLNPHAASRS